MTVEHGAEGVSCIYTGFQNEVASPLEDPAVVAGEAPEPPIEEEKLAEVVPELENTQVSAALVDKGAPVKEKEIVAAPVDVALVESEAGLVEGEAMHTKSVKSKHMVFLSHSGQQKPFAERLCVALGQCYLHPFFDKRDDSLPIGENFAELIFEAIKECHVGVVILSDKYFTSKWPMMELVAMVEESRKRNFTVIPVFFGISLEEFDDPKNRNRWLLEWHELAKNNPGRVEVEKWEAAVRYLRPIKGLVYDGLSDLSLEKKIEKICDIIPSTVRVNDIHIEGREHLCKLRNIIKDGIKGEPIFFAIDNVSDDEASIKEAKNYLSASFPIGSIVMVIARSKDLLKKLRPYINDSKCLEMPELKVEHAKMLFTMSSNFVPKVEDDEQLLERCVKQCYFKKGDDTGSSYYHPLALDVLGRHLGCMDPMEWSIELDKIDEDRRRTQASSNGKNIVNLTNEDYNSTLYDSVFSILRTSFDRLSQDDQLLFLDVALFSPKKPVIVLNWLMMLHEDVKVALGRLKSKSLLENLGDGTNPTIGMHDLWRAFCIAETKRGDLGYRRWVYEARKGGELAETTPCSTCWERVKQMAFLDYLDEVFSDLDGDSNTVESSSSRQWIGGFKERWELRHNSRQLIKQIASLNDLRILVVIGYGGFKRLDVKSMDTLVAAKFAGCKSMVTLTRLSSKMMDLQYLSFSGCRKLHSCPSVGDLVNLEKLFFRGCNKLRRLPNLRKLSKLRVLDICKCPLISEVPGLGDLVALEFLWAGEEKFEFGHDKSPSYRLELPDMRKLVKLRELWLLGCRLKAVSSFDCLTSLQELVADFREVAERPSQGQLTKLRTLYIWGWSSKELGEVHNLVMLQTLYIAHCSNVDKLPDIQSLTCLEELGIYKCDFKDVSGLSNLGTLKSLEIWHCNRLEKIPNLQMLTCLNYLVISGCAILRGWDCTLEHVGVTNCINTSLKELRCLEPMNALSELYVRRCGSSFILPDLCYFPGLVKLDFFTIQGMPLLSSSVPLTTLRVLDLRYCYDMEALPNLGMLPALQELNLECCYCLRALPDLRMFSALERLLLYECRELTTLSSSIPLPTLKMLDARKCFKLRRNDLDQLQALSPHCEIIYPVEEKSSPWKLRLLGKLQKVSKVRL